MEKQTVLIYQMGKVGSSSIYQSLAQSDDFKPYHIHTLNQITIQKIKERSKLKGLKIEQHIYDSEHILGKFFEQTPQDKLKIITLVREPISRNIAAYFQNLDVYHSNNKVFRNSYQINEDTLRFCKLMNIETNLLNTLKTLDKKTFSNSQALLSIITEKGVNEKLVTKYKSRILKATSSHQLYINELIQDFQSNYNHGVPLAWFEKEYHAILGINVFNWDFPRLRGYQRITTENYDCLLIKLETSDRKKERAIKEFLKIDDFSIKNTNFGNSKYYGEAYKAFKSGIQLPNSYINKMLGSQYTKHFYNNIERKDIRKKWQIVS